jgi:hypothetical protein
LVSPSVCHTADNRSYQSAAGKSRRDQCGPARYMLGVEPGPEVGAVVVPVGLAFVVITIVVVVISVMIPIMLLNSHEA